MAGRPPVGQPSFLYRYAWSGIGRLSAVMREGLDGWRQPNTVIVNPRSMQICTHKNLTIAALEWTAWSLRYEERNHGARWVMVFNNAPIQEHGLLLAFLASAIAGAVVAFFLPWSHCLHRKNSQLQACWLVGSTRPIVFAWPHNHWRMNVSRRPAANVLVEGELLMACITLPLFGDVLRRIISDTAVKYFHGTLTERTLSLWVPIAAHAFWRLASHRFLCLLRSFLVGASILDSPLLVKCGSRLALFLTATPTVNQYPALLIVTFVSHTFPDLLQHLAFEYFPYYLIKRLESRNSPLLRWSFWPGSKQRRC